MCGSLPLRVVCLCGDGGRAMQHSMYFLIASHMPAFS